VTGPAGAFTGPVTVTEQVPPGLLFAPYNFAALNAQRAVSDRNCVPVTAARA